MQQSSPDRKNKAEISAVDAMIVAYGQVIQPTEPAEIYESAKGTLVAEILDYKTFKEHFRTLERASYFWQTADKKYVVTPKGEQFARSSLPSKTRDKLRLLMLNKRRYTR